MDGIEVDGQLFTDDELVEQALAADPDQPLADDAVPLRTHQAEFGDVLPEWYMPPPSGRSPRRRNSLVAAVIIGSLLFVNAAGLCVTYGHLELPI